MMKPINGHVLIQPLLLKRGIALTSKEIFEEVGIVVDFAKELDAYSLSSATSTTMTTEPILKNGWKVYFDAWMAAKYPNPDKPEEYFWLVRYEDIRAIDPEHVEQSLSSK